MGTQDQILELIKQKGPVLPVHIAKDINTNILLASAHLSELSSRGKIKISNLKAGGSPFYYLPGQESVLQKHADNLSEKERKSFELLRQKKIIRDSSTDPVTRIALRNIKDFAIPLQVSFENKNEIFWKWFLLTNAEAESLIRTILEPKKEKPIEKKVEKEILKKQIKQEILPTKEPEKKPLKDKPKPLIEKQLKEEAPAKRPFFKNIQEYFSKNKIETIEQTVVRKDAEIDFILKIPSQVGNLKYYCKAKSKKRSNEGDLSTTYIQAQTRKLPALYLTTGDLTKKAKEMLNKEFKGMHIVKI